MRRITTSLLSLPLLYGCAVEPGEEPVYPEAGSEVASRYLANCSLCHQAPLPNSRDASQWPSIVIRMEQQMANKGLGYISENDRNMILQYLERYGQ